MFARLRPWYEKVTLGFGRASVRLGLTPNAWTLFSALAALLAGVLFGAQQLFGGLLLAAVMNIADMLDGATARAGGLASRFGSVLDHVLDRYAEFFLFAGLMIGGYFSPASAVFCASGVIMASYVRAKAESVGGLKSCVVGWAGRQEKLTILYVGIVIALLGEPAALDGAAWVIGVISHWTSLQRLLYTRQQIELQTAQKPSSD